MTSHDEPTRLVARVRYVDLQEDLAYLELPNGNLLPYDLTSDGNEYQEKDVVLIGPRWDDVEPAPPALWPDYPWVGIIRAHLGDEVVVNINGNLKTVPCPEGIRLAEGNTVEGSEVKGIIRVLAEKPIRQFEISLGEPSMSTAFGRHPMAPFRTTTSVGMTRLRRALRS